MKQILTAMNNPKLNQELQKEKNIKIIGNDIPYKEGILEILEKNKNINLIFISENLEGEINFLELIKKIKIINKEIKLIIILNKENNNLENKLKEININNIYYKNKINNKILINIINNKNKIEIKNNNEIKKLKKNKLNIENNKINKNKLNIKKIIKLNKAKVNIIKILNKKIKPEKIKNRKIICITGGKKVGKTTLTLILGYYLSQENKKIAIIDCDFQNPGISRFLKIKKEKNLENKEIKEYKINNNLIFIYNVKKELNNNTENILNKLKNKYDYILFDSPIYYKKIINNSEYILFILKPELKNIKEIYFKYINNFYSKKEKINIIINNYKNNLISLKIISKIFNQKIINSKIKNNIKINKIKNNFYKNKKILDNKKIKKEFNKILLKIKN